MKRMLLALALCLSAFAQAPTIVLTSPTIKADLEKYYGAPAAIAATVQPTTDAAIYFNADYMKALNKQWLQHYAVEVPNSAAAARYDFALSQWLNAGRMLPAPPPPHYVQIDDKLFEAAWSNLPKPLGNAFIVAVPDKPAPTFVADAPAPAVDPTASPIGDDNGGGIFRPSAADSLTRFPNGSTYTDATGTYVKRVFPSMFVGQTVYWVKVG